MHWWFVVPQRLLLRSNRYLFFVRTCSCLSTLFFKVTPTIIQAAKKMRIIGRAGVGIDNIDVKEATKYVFIMRVDSIFAVDTPITLYNVSLVLFTIWR